MLVHLRLTFFAIALMATTEGAAQSYTYHEERRIYGSTKRVIEKRQTTEGGKPDYTRIQVHGSNCDLLISTANAAVN